MRVGTVLEVTLRILRRRWVDMLVLAFLFVGPGALLTAAVGARFDSVALDILPGIDEDLFEGGPLLTGAELERLGGSALAYAAATILAGLLSSIGAVGFAALALNDEADRPSDLRATLLTSLRRAPSVLAFALVTTVAVVGIALAGLAGISAVLTAFSNGALARGGPGVFMALVIGVALVVGLVYLTLRWAMAYPVMAIEPAGWRVALVRSWQLASEHVLRILVIVLTGGLATVVLAALVSQLLAVALVELLAVPAGLDPTIADALAIALATVLLAPLLPVLLAVLYLDLQVRHDGEPWQVGQDEELPVGPATGHLGGDASDEGPKRSSNQAASAVRVSATDELVPSTRSGGGGGASSGRRKRISPFAP
jgi:hypothetical protein